MAFSLDEFKKEVPTLQRSTLFHVDFGVGVEKLQFLCKSIHFDIADSSFTVELYETEELDAYNCLKKLLADKDKYNKILIKYFKKDGSDAGVVDIPLNIVSAVASLDWEEPNKVAKWSVMSVHSED